MSLAVIERPKKVPVLAGTKRITLSPASVMTTSPAESTRTCWAVESSDWPAGPPSLASEEVEEVVAVPAAAGGRKGEFLLRVKGDSMIQAGILDGDLIVVESRADARNGEIVVALLDEDEATVKRFFREHDHVRLQPENDALEPIIVRDVRIAGVVVGLLRTL